MEVADLISLAKNIDRKIQYSEASSVSKPAKKKKKKKRLQDEISVDNAIAECKRSRTGNHKIFTNDDDNTIPEESAVVFYPYEVNPDDHCETKADGYEIIADMLDTIAATVNKTRETLAIYDPYFCEGTMIREMNSLGFMNVYNRKEDFYAVQRDGNVPEYDVLVTNPPYSDVHMEKIVMFCLGRNKPFFLLMPNFVYMKDYYTRLLNQYKHVLPFYVVPTKRLLYTTPKGRRQAKSGKFTSPFPTFWYCHMMSGLTSLAATQLLTTLRSKDLQKTGSGGSGCGPAKSRIICLRPAEFPAEVLTEADPRKKKERNALKRKKNKARKQDKSKA